MKMKKTPAFEKNTTKRKSAQGMFAATGAAAAAAASPTPPTSAADSGKNSNTADDCIDRGGGFSEDFAPLDTKKGCFAKRTKVIILSCVNGSGGDVLPILSLAKTLRAMEPPWTRVCVIANEYFEEMCREEISEEESVNAIEYYFVSKRELYEELLSRKKKKTRSIVDYFLSTSVEHYRVLKLIINSYESFVVCAIPFDFACKFLQEEFEEKKITSTPMQTFEFVSVLLTPALLLCSDVTHHPATGFQCKSSFQFKINDLIVDGMFKKAVNKCRRKLIGLTGRMPRGIFKDYCLLNRILCLFPRWYHTHEIPDTYPLPSKTSRVTQTGFPSTTKSITWQEEEDVSDLLKLGIEESIFARRPKTILIVVSASGNPEISERYFKCVIGAVSTTSLMAKYTVICLTKFLNRLPKKSEDSIDNVFHIDYCPLPALLKYLKAQSNSNILVINHATIGVSRTTLEHGIPQILVPITFDQPDNARRLKLLNVAVVCPMYQFSRRRCLRLLENIENNIDQFQKNCKACQHDLFEREPAGKGLAEAADMILETLSGKTGWQHEMDLVKKRVNLGTT